MRYVMNYTGCGVPRMENRTEVYTINILQFYKILVIGKRSVLFRNVISSPKNFNGGFFSDFSVYIHQYALTVFHLVPFRFNMSFNFNSKVW
jgi:hypothetical protein